MSRDAQSFPLGVTPVAAGHPTAEELVGYAADELEPGLARRLGRHLETCADCRSLVDDFAAYPDLEPPSDAYRVDADELRRARGAARARLLEPGAGDARPAPPAAPATAVAQTAPVSALPAEKPPAAVGPPVTPSPVAAAWIPWTAAAAALVLALAWGTAQKRELDRLRRPQPNVEILTLLPDDNPLRREADPALAAAGTTIIVDLDVVLPPGRYRAEIGIVDDKTDEIVESVERIDGLVPDGDRVAFSLPPGSLPAGVYTIRLVAEGGEPWPETFELRVAE